MKGGTNTPLSGSVKIQISGMYPEEFINLAADKEIRLWDMEVAGKVLVFSTDFSSLKKLKQMQHDRGFSVEILRETGFVVWLRLLGKRKFLLVGFFCFCLAIYYLSGLVWTVELNGLEEINRAEVMEYIRDLGVYKWGEIRRLNFNEIEQNLYVKFPQMAWVAVDRTGTKISIRIVEKEYNPMQFGAVIDIVAEYDGIIFEMMVLKGIPKVEPGMTVAKGDVLIAGYRDGDNMINAAGSVKGRVFLEGYGEAALEEIEKSYTGRQQQVDILQLWGKKIPLSRRPRFENYEVEESSTSIYSTNIVFLRRLYSEIILNTNIFSPAEADELALLRAMIAAHAQVEEQAVILSKEVEKVSLGEGLFGYRALLTVETSIGRERVQIRGE
ncbi:MAG: sporulation protein YqfD [Eubacteriales bacterium]|nr:sporulation protein YqfD [Eubacteriales bacterium]